MRDAKGRPAFRIGLSIEKEVSAFSTLTLRAAYRHLRHAGRSAPYFDFVRGDLSWQEFEKIPVVAEALAQASMEARQHELGKTDERQIDREIRTALKGERDWVLIGGPPCQAYSLVGRARRAKDESFAADEKHFLYREYLRIIREHAPAVFVMENVKGLLSSKHSGEHMFERICEDLSHPRPDLEYEICSFVRGGTSSELLPNDYVIEAESFGIPQTRHRVILLGIRKGYRMVPSNSLLMPMSSVSVSDAISDLPGIRSRLSRGNDSMEAWLAAVRKGPKLLGRWRHPDRDRVHEVMVDAASRAERWTGTGGLFIPRRLRCSGTEFSRWIHSAELAGVTLHEARSHMATDLARYLFAAAFASTKQGEVSRESPRLRDFPPNLLPEHRSATAEMESGATAFQDRFRVQRRFEPSSTIVSHIAKDGHYYIHYAPEQCRSLTVREAARLQTFPDDYFFRGNRTQQYAQVGNAVPPLLAFKLASSVLGLMQGSAQRQLDLAA